MTTTERVTCPRCGETLAAGTGYVDPTLPCPGESPMTTVFWTAWFAGCFARIDTVDGPLIVNARRDIESPREGSVTLTSDGRHADVSGWCTCGAEGEWARYERYSIRGREAHGFVCATCRRITQTG